VSTCGDECESQEEELLLKLLLKKKARNKIEKAVKANGYVRRQLAVF
jgi:hypothetical protein